MANNLPAGMRNNNPGNIKFSPAIDWQGQVGPSLNTDQGDPQVVFQTPQAGMRALAKNVLYKYNHGYTTINRLIAGPGGWTPGFAPGAAGVASAAGLPADQPVDMNNPDVLAHVVRGIVTQEQGPSSRLYSDQLINNGVGAAMVKHYDSAGNPIQPQAAQQPVPLAPLPGGNMPAPAAAASPDDDALLAKYLGGDAAAQQPATANAAPASAASSNPDDDALLAKYLGSPDTNVFGTTAKPGTPEYAKAAVAAVQSGAPLPAAPATQAPDVGAPAGDVVPPWARAFSENAVNSVPVVGALMHNERNALMGPEGGAQMDALGQSASAANPIAAGAGTVFGTVAPLMAAGATGLGARVLGTAGDYGLGTVGNFLTRSAAGGLSSAALSGGDTLARGGSVDDARRNALLAGGIGAAASPVAAALGSVKGLLAKSAVGAGLGAAAGGAGTLVAGGSPQDAGRNALMGAGVGAGLGAASSAVGTVANRLMQGGISPDAAVLADKAINQFGIPLGAADISGNPMVKVAKSVVDKMPFSGGTTSSAAQNAAFTHAVANEMGTDATALTPDVMAATRDRIGDVFDSVATKVPAIPADPQFQNDVLQAMQDAEGSLGADKMVPFNKQVDNIMSTFGNGNAITGQQFLSLTDKKSILSKAIASGGDLGNAASALKDALFGAMERAAPPDVLPALQKARYQWKVMKTVQDNVAKSVDGTLSPPTLMTAVVKNFPNMAYDGGGNMGDLARIGQRFLKAPGSSQTSERNLINHLVSGGGLAGLFTAPHVAVPALAGTLGASTAAGAAMRSKWLANSLIRGPQAFDPTMNALTRSAVPLVTGPNPSSGPLQIVVRGANPAQ